MMCGLNLVLVILGVGGMMEFGKDVEDRYSAGDLQNMFYKDDNEDGSRLKIKLCIITNQ